MNTMEIKITTVYDAMKHFKGASVDGSLPLEWSELEMDQDDLGIVLYFYEDGELWTSVPYGMSTSEFVKTGKTRIDLYKTF